MKRKIIILLIVSLLCLTLVLSGCGGSGKIQLATKPMTEQFILGEMIKMVVEDNTDHEVEITKGVGGGTSNIQAAMLKGDFDMYPEYTGTAWQFVLNHDSEGDIPKDELMPQLQQEYQDEFDFEWVGMYGFGDQFGIAVKKEIADQNNITTFSDLAPLTPELTFGAEPDFFERSDGYEALSSAYGFEFSKTMDIDIGLKYSAINNGEVDVINIFTTDGQLATADVTVLQDDKGFFISDYCGTVVRTEALDEYPGLREALMKLDGVINEEEMTRMNYDVDEGGKEDAEVAKDFLVSKGIISAS